MKKILSFIAVASFCMMFAACFGEKKDAPKAEGADAEVTKSEEVNAEAEEAVKAYEDWLVKYDDLTARSVAGEDVSDEIIALQETVFDISKKLIATESKRNADQKARVKAVEEKTEKIQKERVFN